MDDERGWPMASSFNIEEILEMATQIERNGGRFYRHAATIAGDAAVEATLEMLAAMEDEHEITFERMRAEGGLPDIDADLDGQTQAYLRAVADGFVFDTTEDPTAVLAGDPDALTILHIAIGREKDAVTLFAGLKIAMPEGWGRDRVDAIVREELSHIAILSDEIKKLKERSNV
jgi:rubrerythrin